MPFPQFIRIAVSWLAKYIIEQPTEEPTSTEIPVSEELKSNLCKQNLADAPHVLCTGRDMFVRVINGKLAKWQEGSPDSVDALLKSHFTDVRGVSIFRVSNDIDECEVAAAVKLNSGSLPKDAAVVRVPVEVLNELSITPKRTLGSTGVGPVDQRHHDLIPDPKQLRLLVTKLLELQLEGCDLVRQTRRTVLDSQLLNFSEMEDCDLEADIRQKCRVELERRS